MAVRTLLKITLVNGTTLVADGVGYIEGEVVATLLCSHLKQLAVLSLGEMLLKVAVKCRTTGQMLDVLDTVQTESVNYVQCSILNLVEVAVVEVTGNYLTVLLIPLGVLYTYVLGRNHFTVEHDTL